MTRIFRPGTKMTADRLEKLRTPRIQMSGGRIRQAPDSIAIDIPLNQEGDGAVAIYNSEDSGANDIPAFGVAMIVGSQSDDLGVNATRTVYTVEKPASGNLDQLAVIAKDEVGYENGGEGFIGGVRMCLLDRDVGDTTTYKFAKITADQFSLEVGTSGEFLLIWEEQDGGNPKTGEHLGLVYFGGGAAASTAMKLVSVGNGNNITPSGYTDDTWYGLDENTSKLTEVPTTTPSGAAGSFTTGLSPGQLLEDSSTVWIGTWIDDSDGVERIGDRRAYPENAEVWAVPITVDVTAGGTTTLYLLGGST